MELADLVFLLVCQLRLWPVAEVREVKMLELWFCEQFKPAEIWAATEGVDHFFFFLLSACFFNNVSKDFCSSSAK